LPVPSSHRMHGAAYSSERGEACCLHTRPARLRVPSTLQTERDTRGNRSAEASVHMRAEV